MIRIITEILGLVLGQLDLSFHNLGRKVWAIVFGAVLAGGAVFIMLIGIGFLGFALYHNLVVSVGASMAAFIVGGFFILIALILLIISKNLIKRR